MTGDLPALTVEELTDPRPLLVSAPLESLAAWPQPFWDPGYLAAYVAHPPEGVRPAFLRVADGGGSTLGLAAFARFRVALDCLAPLPVQRFASRVRRAWPAFLGLDVLMLGPPAGLGGLELLVKPGLDAARRAALRAALARHLLALLDRERASAAVVKELSPAEDEEWAGAFGDAFHSHPSVPLVVQDLGLLASLDDYRAALRSGYRRQLLASLSAADAAGLELRLDRPPADTVSAWYPLFLQVLDRSATRLETLPAGFFTALSSDPGYRMNEAWLDGKLAGGALWRRSGDTLVFLYVGMDYAVARDCDVYFNLLHSILASAFATGARRIVWGQTSLEAKGRFGGLASPLRFRLRLRSPLADRAVRALGSLFFPERPQTARRVFRSSS